MRTLIDQYSGSSYLLFHFINMAGQFLEALFLFAFVGHVFLPRRGNGKTFLWGCTLAMTVVTVLADLLSHNNTNLWILVIIAFPFAMLLLFCRGGWPDKLVHCVLCADILISLESVSVSLTNIALEYKAGPYVFLVFLYACRRLLMKGLLLLALRFLSKNTKTVEYSHRLSWYSLGLLSAAELLLLWYLRTHRRPPFEQLPLEFFCALMPLLFYVTLNLLEDAFRRDKIALMLQAQLEAQQQYLTELSQAQESLRRFRHDYRSHLLCIDALAEEGNMEELHSYLSSLTGNDTRLDNYVTYSQNGLLNALLNQKRAVARQRGVDLDILVVDFPLRAISAYDLNVLLTNLIDNAIEAAATSKEREVRLKIAPNRDYLEIKIRNSTLGNVLTSNPLFSTSKKDAANHGYGMKIVQSLIQKYDGVSKMDAGPDWLEIRMLLLDEGF